MSTLLITGGAGFIGCNLVRCALEQATAEDRIVVVDKLTYAGSLLNLEDPLRIRACGSCTRTSRTAGR